MRCIRIKLLLILSLHFCLSDARGVRQPKKPRERALGSGDTKTKKEKISKGNKESASMEVGDESYPESSIGEEAEAADQGGNEELDGVPGSGNQMVGGGDDTSGMEENAPDTTGGEESTSDKEIEEDNASKQAKTSKSKRSKKGLEKVLKRSKLTKSVEDFPSEAPTSGPTQEDIGTETEEAQANESETTGGGSGRTGGLIVEDTGTGSEESGRQGPLELAPFEIVYNLDDLEVVPMAEHYGEAVAVTVEFIEQYMREVYDDAVEYVSAVVTAKRFVDQKPRLGFAVTILFVERVGYMFPHDVTSKLNEAFISPYVPYYINMLNMLPVENEFQRTEEVIYVPSDTTLPDQAYHFTNKAIVPSHSVQERVSEPEGKGLSATPIIATGIIAVGLLLLTTRRRTTDGPVYLV